MSNVVRWLPAAVSCGARCAILSVGGADRARRADPGAFALFEQAKAAEEAGDIAEARPASEGRPRSSFQAREALRRANGNVKLAVLLLHGRDVKEATDILDSAGGQLRAATLT